MRAKVGAGRTVRRLTSELEKRGYSNVELWPALGYWRKSVADVMPLDGTGIWEGLRVTICSWATCTELLKKGFTVRKEEPTWHELELQEKRDEEK